MYPHEKREPMEYGRSPGNGITPAPLSAEPLATEGEATPGPDDVNPYDKFEAVSEASAQEDPTDGDDPYFFDDVFVAESFELPEFRF